MNECIKSIVEIRKPNRYTCCDIDTYQRYDVLNRFSYLYKCLIMLYLGT